jgi:hypothetical protein
LLDVSSQEVVQEAVSRGVFVESGMGSPEIVVVEVASEPTGSLD